ncbi:MAG: redoxin domain-containing protein [Planctomycetia bacterium]|nr:redoxin domain-containing protein [Planctomycetia bacterium]
MKMRAPAAVRLLSIHRVLVGLVIAAFAMWAVSVSPSPADEGTATNAPAAAPAVGATVADFSLKDIHRRLRSLASFKEAKAFVVVFIGAECPLANLYVPTLVELHKEHVDRGVEFLAVNSNVQDTFTLVSAHAQEREIPFPVLKDFDHKAANAFGATRTPEAFLLDANRVIRYHGRIDDQYAVGVRRDEPTRRDLKIAIDELLAGKPVAIPTTDISGCVIARAKSPRTKSEVNYASHVAPLVQKHCQECHRDGEIGPMSLLNYEDAKNWGDTIREVIVEERMPPWHADPRFGKFKNDRRLSQDEKNTLIAWVEQGCQKGDEKDLPPPLTFTKGWRIGQPDAVFHMTQEFKVPATGILPYKKFAVDPGFKEDVWVQSAECRPGNRAVVHHILVYIQEKSKLFYEPDGTAATLVGWAPGDMPVRFPPGTAKRIPAGAKIVFEVHYTPNGTEQTDRSSVGVIFAKGRPEREAETNILANMLLTIPPGSPNHRDQLLYIFRDDALVLSFMPHMHLRGTSAKYVATYPDGRTETLLSVPDYDFNWQSVYRFAEPLRVPKGTKLAWISTWDNSPDNPRNPDATKEVRWGFQTWDEMHNGWMELVWEHP